MYHFESTTTTIARGFVMAKKTALYSLRMRPEIKQRAEKAAAAECRSLSNLIELLLAQHFQQHEETSRILKGTHR
jgi:hypothetical protein